MEDIGWRHDIHTDSPAELAEIRGRIDEIDGLVSRLLAERLTLARRLPGVKAKLGLPIQDIQREAEVLDRVMSEASDQNLRQAIRTIYESIMEQSRDLQVLAQPTSTTAAVSGRDQSRQKRSMRARRPIHFTRVAIIGVGLIGGALARQIKRAMPQTTIVGIDTPGVLEAALREQVIDAAATDPAAGIARASLVILAAGPDENLKLLKRIAPALRRRQLVVDVTSAKVQICKLAERLDLNGADFIGGHPLFGSEKRGIAGSAEIGVEGKTFCLVPTSISSEISIKRLSRWLSLLGLRVEITNATTHDATLARLSHLIQLIAVAVGAEIAEGKTDNELEEMLSLSGTSFRQVARLMTSPSDLWKEIVGQNRQEIVPALTQLSQRLQSVAQSIELGTAEDLKEAFQQASRIPPLLK